MLYSISKVFLVLNNLTIVKESTFFLKGHLLRAPWPFWFFPNLSWLLFCLLHHCQPGIWVPCLVPFFLKSYVLLFLVFSPRPLLLLLLLPGSTSVADRDLLLDCRSRKNCPASKRIVNWEPPGVNSFRVHLNLPGKVFSLWPKTEQSDCMKTESFLPNSGLL